MAESVRHEQFEHGWTLFMGDLKLTRGGNGRRQWLRVESLSGLDIPPLEMTASKPPSHKFVASTAEVG